MGEPYTAVVPMDRLARLLEADPPPPPAPDAAERRELNLERVATYDHRRWYGSLADPAELALAEREADQARPRRWLVLERSGLVRQVRRRRRLWARLRYRRARHG